MRFVLPVLSFSVVLLLLSSCGENRQDESISMAEYQKRKPIDNQIDLLSRKDVFDGYIFGHTYSLLYFKERLATTAEDSSFLEDVDENSLSLKGNLQMDIHSLIMSHDTLTDKFDMRTEKIKLFYGKRGLITNSVCYFNKLSYKERPGDSLPVPTALRGNYMVPIGMTSGPWSSKGSKAVVFFTPGVFEYRGKTFYNPVIVFDEFVLYIFSQKQDDA
ncbi:MAG: hypothetical protein FJZ66_08780 [Bacteroidetes bacterium]|nr:hypothetical protein [Bacteroidota bacterium]